MIITSLNNSILCTLKIEYSRIFIELFFLFNCFRDVENMKYIYRDDRLTCFYVRAVET